MFHPGRNMQTDRKAYQYRYSAMEEDLEARIKNGSWPAGTQIPSENELSRQYGISRMSARQAITNLVGRKLLYRMAGKGTFVAFPGEPASGGNTIIGLVLNNISNPFFARLIRVVQRRALASGYDMIFYSNNNLIEESQAVETLLRRKVAGVILIPSQESGEEVVVAKLQNGGIPVLYLNRKLARPEADSVVTDNLRGAGLVMEHLHQLGHRQIGFIAAHPYSEAISARMEGYKAFMKKNGLAENASVQVSFLFNENGGFEAGRNMLRAADRPTAIFCGNDITAIGVLKAARELKIKVPDELSLAGYDDIEIASHLPTPLTTVAQPVEQMAELAIEILMKRIGDAGAEMQQLVLPPKLIVRETTKAAGRASCLTQT